MNFPISKHSSQRSQTRNAPFITSPIVKLTPIENQGQSSAQTIPERTSSNSPLKVLNSNQNPEDSSPLSMPKPPKIFPMKSGSLNSPKINSFKSIVQKPSVLVSKPNEKNSIVKPMKLPVELDPEPEVPESSSLTEILYHMTNRDSAEKIKSSNKMIPGIKGKFGPAIYFTDNPLTCASKSIFGSTSLITAKVQLRNMLESNVPLPYINKQILEKYRKNSVKGNFKHSEYAVYDSEDVEVLNIDHIYDIKEKFGSLENIINFQTKLLTKHYQTNIEKIQSRLNGFAQLQLLPGFNKDNKTLKVTQHDPVKVNSKIRELTEEFTVLSEDWRDRESITLKGAIKDENVLRTEDKIAGVDVDLSDVLKKELIMEEGEKNNSGKEGWESDSDVGIGNMYDGKQESYEEKLFYESNVEEKKLEKKIGARSSLQSNKKTLGVLKDSIFGENLNRDFKGVEHVPNFAQAVLDTAIMNASLNDLNRIHLNVGLNSNNGKFNRIELDEYLDQVISELSINGIVYTNEILLDAQLFLHFVFTDLEILHKFSDFNSFVNFLISDKKVVESISKIYVDFMVLKGIKADSQDPNDIQIINDCVVIAKGIFKSHKLLNMKDDGQASHIAAVLGKKKYSKELNEKALANLIASQKTENKKDSRGLLFTRNLNGLNLSDPSNKDKDLLTRITSSLVTKSVGDLLESKNGIMMEDIKKTDKIGEDQNT